MLYHELTSIGIDCVRKYRFEAAHREYSNKLNYSENLTVYKHNRYMHGHNFEIHALLRGNINYESDMVVELSSIDKLVNEYIIDKYDHRVIEFEKYPSTHEYITETFSDILIGELPYYHGIILIENPDRAYTKVIDEDLPMVYRTHIVDFTATHQLTNPNLGKERNDAIFGKCQRLHGHNYKLSVTISGTPNDRTGLLINAHDFDKIIKKVCENYDYEKLHELERFRNSVATTENFIKILWEDLTVQLSTHINFRYPKFVDFFAGDLSLQQIVLQETDRNVFIYRGE